MNPADWATKPRLASELGVDSFWQSGPRFLSEDFANWPIRQDFKTCTLEGELKLNVTHVVLQVSEDVRGKLDKLLQDTSSARKLFRIVAHAFKWHSISQNSVDRLIKGVLNVKDIDKARKF